MRRNEVGQYSNRARGREGTHGDGTLGELDRLLNVEAVKVDRATRLSLVVLCKRKRKVSARHKAAAEANRAPLKIQLAA